MGRFADDLRGHSKIRNHPQARAAKAWIRALVLEAVGAAHVFDAFAGDGRMHADVWSRAASYVGCDLEWFRDGRLAYVADNLRVLRAVDLAPFNVFDLDAFGSPWEQALIIAARRKAAPGERIGLAVTEGSGLALKMGDLPRAMAELLGLRGRPAGSIRWQEELIGQALQRLAQRMGARLVQRWDARRGGGSAMRYIGIVIEGVSGAGRP